MKTYKICILNTVAAAMLMVTPAWSEWAPERPLEFIAAAGAGGGTDSFARTIQSVLTNDDIIEQSAVVLNKGAGGGVESFLYAKANAGDPNKLIFGTNNVYLLPHVVKLAYTADDLQPVAIMALDEFVLWVKDDSPYQNVQDLIDDAKARPKEIIFSGSQTKDMDDTLVALIEQTAGVEFKYIPFDGGGQASVQLAGGHVTANLNNPNENIGQWQAGAVRPLCVFSAKRMAESEPIKDGKGWQDIPTCSEQGLDIENYQIPRSVWLPADTPPEALAYYQNALKAVTESSQWEEYLKKTSQTGAFITGEELDSFIDESENKAVGVFDAQGWIVN